MRIALLQANIGDFDDVKPIPEQSVPYDYFLYTENNLPYPLPNLNNRLKGKYLKINSHRFLTHDYFIWIDGRVEITSDKFIESMVTKSDVTISIHPTRNNPYEEIDYIQRRMNEGSEYLNQRYSEEPFKEEVQFYKKKGMKDVPLYACYCFGRPNNKRMNQVFQEWWMTCLEFSNFDQSQFSYIAWRHKLNISTVEPLIKLGTHK
jgi:hypothetical protein